MMTLVIGGAASGKSAYAESLLGGAEKKCYIATMQPFGKEAEERIRKHRAMRAGKGFVTAECGTARSILELSVPSGTAALLEDLGNLCANELFSGEAEKDAADVVIRAVTSLSRQCSRLVIVTNEAHSGGTEYAGETLSWLRVLGQVNLALAARADRVTEVQCGIPILLKGAGDEAGPESVPGKKIPGKKRKEMVFVTGPMFSGKREAAAKLLGKEFCSISEVQTLAAECKDDSELEQLAERLSEYEVVIASETGGGVVPLDPETRSAREKAGRLNCLLADRAETVIRVICGIPQVIKGRIEKNEA